MATIGNISIGMSVYTGRFFKGLKSARSGLTSFTSGLSGLGSKLTGLISPMGAAAGGLAGLAGIGGSLALGVKLAGEAEQAEIAFSTLLGSGEKARGFLADLSKFAASTPFQLPELRDGAQKLLAFGFSAEEVKARVQTLGDIAAGTGKPIGEFISIIGKMKASGGFANLGDLNMIADRGVPLFDLLSKQLGVTAVEIKKMASTGKISLAQVETALGTATAEGGLFHGSMEKNSQSLFGIFSTMKDNISFVLQELGRILIEEFNFKGALTSVITFAQSTLASIQEWAPVIRSSFSVVKESVFAIGAMFKSVWDAVVASWMPIIDSIMPKSESTFGSWKEAIFTALIAVEYGLKNWRTIAEKTFLQVYLSIITFVENFKHFFMKTLPQVIVNYVKFSIDNFKKLIHNIGQVIKYITTLGKHKIQFQAPDFGKLIENLPERQRSALEQNIQGQIEAIDGKLGSGFSSYLEKRKNELGLLKKPAEAVAEAVEPKKGSFFGMLGNMGMNYLQQFMPSAETLQKMRDAALNAPTAQEPVFASAALQGTAEARQAILKHQFGAPDKDPVAINTKETAKAVNALLTWFKGKGTQEELQPV